MGEGMDSPSGGEVSMVMLGLVPVGPVEVAGLCGIVLFLLVLVTGRAYNGRVASAVDAGLKRSVSPAYALEGRLRMDRQTRREGWWSGRKHVVGFHAVLQLVSRQDVVKRVVSWVLPRREDVLTLDVILRKNTSMTCVAGMYDRRRVKAARRSLWDLATFCSEREVRAQGSGDWPPPGVVSFGEPGAAMQDLLGPNSAFAGALAGVSDLGLLRCVHVTDQNGAYDAEDGESEEERVLRGLRGVPLGTRCVVRVEAALPRRLGEVQAFVAQLATAVHALADAAVTYRMDPAESAGRKRARVHVEEQKRKAEMKRRAEKVHKEKQSNMTAEDVKRQAKRKQDRKLRKGSKQVKIL